ncbi:MAG: Ig-like domain-containing protein, partial [Tannerella sp.]|nr:Ig-like domain-containing protein [Tannerella sp.]
AEGAVVITGGSVKMNNTLGPQPTNGEGANVYLNTLTIGDPAVDDTIYVTAGSIGGAICINGVPAQEEVADGKYGIHDVYTRDGGKVYFYLPASGVDVYKTSLLVVDNVGYMRSYIRNNNVANTQTLIIPELVITGKTTGGDEIHGGTTPGEDHIAGWTGDALTVKQSGKYTISMHEGVTTTTKATIKVLSGVEADITLDNVSIDVYNMYSVSGPCAFGIMAGATVRLTLQGDNVLKSDNISAGLQVPYGAALTITEESNGSSLKAYGGYQGAGIGGGSIMPSGDITIYGGNVTATGGGLAPGIGKGNGVNSTSEESNITIYGGTIIAFGGTMGAGIGSGMSSKSGGIITIHGGDVTATGGQYGAGIGAGSNVNSIGSNIKITGGTVRATGGQRAAGIGSGDSGEVGTIEISGGTITASAGSDDSGGGAAGIGYGIIWAGPSSSTGTVIITGGTITATAFGGAGIGDGKRNSGENPITVTITGGSVKTSGGIPGPQPTNGEGADVYLNTLTIGDPAVDDTIYVTAGSIGGADCIDGVPEQADVIAGKYGIHDVYTRDGGKVYFYLPATNGEEEEAVFLTVDDGSDNGTEYANGFARPADDFNEQTLITGLPAIVSVTPADNSVALDGDVVITFNRKMSTDLTGVNVTLNGVPLDLDDASWSPNQDVVTIPYSDLSHGTNYVIRFSGFKDKAKQAITPVTSDAYAFTTVHSYSASGDKTEWDFGMEKFAYNSIEPQTFVITNNGTGALTSLQAQLIGADPAFFEITANLDADNLAAGNTANISVRPIDGLSYRLSPYTATLRLTGDNGFSFLIDVSFRVEKAEPMLEYLNYEIPPIIYFDELDHNIAVTPKDKYAPHLGEITVKYNGSEELPYAPGVYTVTIEISEGRNYLSGFFEVGQFTIYRPPTPYILREVTIEPTLHFDTDPRPDIYYVKSSTDMIITLTPRSSLPEGYVPQVTTNRIAFPDSQSGNIRIALNDDGTYTVRIVRITEPTIVTITAIPDMSIGTSNAPLDIASPQVWSYGSRLYIRSATSGEAAVYHISGRLLEVLPFEAGETRSQFLPAGVYVVRIDGKSHKVLLY